MRQELKSQIKMNGISCDGCFSQELKTIQVKNSKTNLYIKGLPSTFSDEDIVNLAPTRSAIRSVKVALEDDKRCKGYGFIDFLTPEDAKSGLAYIEEKNPNYTIKFAKENEKDKTNLYVSNLPKSWTSRDSEKLKSLFGKYGEIQSAFIMLEKYGSKPLGVGFVRFFNEESAYRAITDLEVNPFLISDECIGPLEAKYADKHSADTRRKNPVNKFGLNGKLQSSNHLPLLTNPNSAQLLTALFDESYSKAPYLCPIPQSNGNDAYNQYILSLAQFGMIDPYCFVPTMVTPSSTNYFSSYNNSSGCNQGNYYPNMIYSLQPNVKVDPITASNVPYLVPSIGHTQIPTNVPFLQNFNEIV